MIVPTNQINIQTNEETNRELFPPSHHTFDFDPIQSSLFLIPVRPPHSSSHLDRLTLSTGNMHSAREV